MFAYCLNNPVVNVDYSGCLTQEKRVTPIIIVVIIDDGCGSPEGGEIGGGGGVDPVILLIGLVDALCRSARYAWCNSKKNNDTAVYYGMDLYGGNENIITKAMTFDQAAEWATSMAASRKYSERQAWGLYTEKKDDAIAMAFFLGKYAEFIHDKREKGHYAHYHTAFRQIYGIPAKNFHIWYGEKGV